MKKTLLFLFLLLLAPLLIGCGSLYAQRREVEQLQVMETLGLDPAPGGVVLSLASSSGVGEGKALCYSAAGASCSDAMDRLRSRSLEELLFCGHLQHILIGEEAARQGLDGFLAFVCRSSDLRLDMPMYLVLDTSAEDTMRTTGAGEKNIADALTAMEEDRDKDSRLSTAGTVLRDLERQGSSLVRTLRVQDAAEEDPEGARTVVPEGFGVLVDGKLTATISPEDALAVQLLTGALSPYPLVVYDDEGRAVTLELQEGSARLRPVWGEDGALSGLDAAVEVRAVVLEIDGFEQVADEQVLGDLNARMETEISRRLGNVLRLSRRLEADFLGLGRQLEQQAPKRCRGLDQELGPLLPALSLSVSVRGEISHSHDIT